MLHDSLKKFLKDEGGQSIIEYSLLMVLIAASTMVLLTMWGISIRRMVGMNDFTVESYSQWAYEKYRSKE